MKDIIKNYIIKNKQIIKNYIIYIAALICFISIGLSYFALTYTSLAPFFFIVCNYIPPNIALIVTNSLLWLNPLFSTVTAYIFALLHTKQFCDLIDYLTKAKAKDAEPKNVAAKTAFALLSIIIAYFLIAEFLEHLTLIGLTGNFVLFIAIAAAFFSFTLFISRGFVHIHGKDLNLKVIATSILAVTSILLSINYQQQIFSLVIYYQSIIIPIVALCLITTLTMLIKEKKSEEATMLLILITAITLITNSNGFILYPQWIMIAANFFFFASITYAVYISMSGPKDPELNKYLENFSLLFHCSGEALIAGRGALLLLGNRRIMMLIIAAKFFVELVVDSTDSNHSHTTSSCSVDSTDSNHSHSHAISNNIVIHSCLAIAISMACVQINLPYIYFYGLLAFVATSAIMSMFIEEKNQTKKTILKCTMITLVACTCVFQSVELLLLSSILTPALLLIMLNISPKESVPKNAENTMIIYFGYIAYFCIGVVAGIEATHMFAISFVMILLISVFSVITEGAMIEESLACLKSKTEGSEYKTENKSWEQLTKAFPGILPLIIGDGHAYGASHRHG